MDNLKKYNRFFAFGCSMTAYHWPTWADAIACEIPESYNYGKSGGGNMFIACQVSEANIRHKFTKDDLVMIMWSGVSREDRYIKNSWLTPGNIYTQNYYNQDFIDKFADSKGFMVRDLNMIALTKGLLESTGTTYHMLSMAPLVHLQSADTEEITGVDELLEMYAPILNSILPDILTAELNGRWPQHPIRNPVPGGQTADYHPSPRNHFDYLNKLFPKLQWSSSTLNFITHHQKIVEDARLISDLVYATPLPKRV